MDVPNWRPKKNNQALSLRCRGLSVRLTGKWWPKGRGHRHTDYRRQKTHRSRKAEYQDFILQTVWGTKDILTQKVLKSLYILLHENIKTIIDSANLLEKLDIIDTADDLLNIREIRNQIAHDYVTEKINGFYLEVLNYVPHLKQIVENVKAFYSLKLK